MGGRVWDWEWECGRKWGVGKGKAAGCDRGQQPAVGGAMGEREEGGGREEGGREGGERPGHCSRCGPAEQLSSAPGCIGHFEFEGGYSW